MLILAQFGNLAVLALGAYFGTLKLVNFSDSSAPALSSAMISIICNCKLLVYIFYGNSF